MKLKKIIALGMGLALIGVTLGGCASYPTVDGKELKTADDIRALVEDAKDIAYKQGELSVDVTADNEGVIDKAVADAKVLSDIEIQGLKDEAERDAQIIADYKSELTALETVETAAQSGYEKDDLELNKNISGFTLDDSDLGFLQDTKIKFDGEKYDIHEEIGFSEVVGIRTSVYDSDFKDAVYLTLEDSGALEYRYVFDDKVNITAISEATPLKINFLGDNIDISDVSIAEFTTISGAAVLLREGELVTLALDGQDINVEALIVDHTQGRVSIQLDGEFTTIDEGDVEEVGGFEVYVDSIIGNDDTRLVEIRIGKDILNEYKYGDEVIEGDERWTYTIEVEGDQLEYFGVIYSDVSDNLDDEYAPIKPGENYILPNNFATIGLETTDVEYIKYRFTFTDYMGENVLRIVSQGAEGIVVGSDEISKGYFNGTKFIYRDDNNDLQYVNLSEVKLINDDVELPLSFNDSILTINDNIELAISDFNYLGVDGGVAEKLDVVYNGDGYGTRDESVMTSEGIIIEDPESNAESDKVVLQIPSEEVTATITVG